MGMRKHSRRDPCTLFLAVLLLFLWPARIPAQAAARQSSPQEKEQAAQAVQGSTEAVTVPEGTPLTLELVSGLSSATAKGGDPVQFKTRYPLRIDGWIVVPQGTVVSGTVVEVRRPRRPSKHGQVSVAIHDVVLPGGKTAPLRHTNSQTKKPADMAARAEPGDMSKTATATLLVLHPLGALFAPTLLFTKGHEAVYPVGTRGMAYFNGPATVELAVLRDLQPPPYKGPPQVFFTPVGELSPYTGLYSDRYTLFCGEAQVRPFHQPFWMLFNPGKHTFTARLAMPDFHRLPPDKIRKKEAKIAEANRKSKFKSLVVELREDHQYWIARDSQGLSLRELPRHQTEFDIVRIDLRWNGLAYVSAACLPAPADAEPASDN